MCRTLAAWQEVSRVGMFLEICLPCKGIVLEGLGCRIYSCVLRPSVISLESDAESLLHCLCINLRKHRFMQRQRNPDYLSRLQVPVFGSDTLPKVLAQNKQRSQSCTQNAGQHHSNCQHKWYIWCTISAFFSLQPRVCKLWFPNRG